MVKNFYDYDIDKAICYALLKYQKIESQRKLNWIIASTEYLGRIIHEKTFRYHLKKMLNAGYIRIENKVLSLASSTRERMELNSLVIRYAPNIYNSEKEVIQSYHKLKKKELVIEKRSELELRRDRIYYIVFRVLSIESPNSRDKYPGVSVTNIMKARYDGHAFYYLRLEDYSSLVEECITNLLKLNIIKPINGIPGHEEPRYEFVETIYKEFVNDISEELEHDITLRLHLVWQNLRPPTPQDRLYFEWCWGARDGNGKLNKVYDILQENKKGNLNYNKNKKEKEDLIKSLDCNIIDVMKDLKETYGDLIKKSPFMWKTIIETVYPDYLQKDVEKIMRTSEYKEKKYPKLKRVITKSTIVIRDSVKTHKENVVTGRN